MSIPFHRTPRGLSNQAIFAKVDAILFAEGGNSNYLLRDIEEGAGDSSTLDGAFWSTVARMALPGRAVEVRSVGNKRTVEAIAVLIEQGAASHVIAALDRDFDHRRGTRIVHPNVLYTFGYSWENDVFRQEVVADLIKDLAPPPSVLSKSLRVLKEAELQLAKCFFAVVRLDYSLASQGEELTLRDELRCSVKVHHQNAPSIDRSIIAAELRRHRLSNRRCGLGPPSCVTVQGDLHGHTLSKWWMGQLNHLLRTQIGLKMSRDLLARLAIATYSRRSDLASWLYYSAAMRAVEI